MIYIVYVYRQIYYCNEKFRNVEWKVFRVCAMDLQTKYSLYQRPEFLILHYTLSTCLVIQFQSQSLHLIKGLNLCASKYQLQLYSPHSNLCQILR